MGGELGWTTAAKISLKFYLLKSSYQDFPDCPVVTASPSNVEGAGLIPDWEAKIPHASQPKKSESKTEALF